MADDLINVEELAHAWHLAKQTIDILEEAYKKALKTHPKYVQAKAFSAFLEGELMKFLETTHQKNASTRFGTIHTVTRYSAPISDPDEFMGFVIENRRWDMLDKKANVTAVKDWNEEHKELPPGVQLSANTRLS